MPILVALALCFSFVFLVLAFRTKKGEPGKVACFVAFSAWTVYATYEGIYIRDWLKTIRGAPIRADLMLFVPLLAAVSIVALRRLAKRNTSPG